MTAPGALHLRTWDAGPGPTVVVNGVPLNADSWVIQGPQGWGVPVQVQLTFYATIEPEPAEVPDEPEPEPERCSITVNVNVAGNVLAEKDLQNRIAEQVTKLARASGLRGYAL